MSEYSISFIPNSLNYKPTENQIKQLSEYAITDCITTFETGEMMVFADCGGNFESVACPYCHADVMGWWGDAMDSAYSPESGFMNLAVRMPCCGMESTLNDLEYYFPQGFYRTRILAKPTIGARAINIESVCADLKMITGVAWRAVHEHL